MAIRGVLVGVAVCMVGLTTAPVASSAAPVRASGPPAPVPACDPGPEPFAGIPGADLAPSIHASGDRAPVDYVLWSGYVPSFDGLPLSVDVTVPCAGSGPRPSVTVLHGFTDDKTVWEETGKSDTVRSTDRPGANDRWNNIWFASRGYVTLTYTARGWRDSCGPDTPTGTSSRPAPRCDDFQSWIHLDDKRWEVRDAQWLTSGLVQSGVADPERLAITGGSYGGAPSTSAALLADNVMCGAVPVPAELGEDPCDGKGDGELAPWTTPDGSVRLDWAAALPLYTFSDLLRVLAPNGRWSDGTVPTDPGTSTEPFGVPLSSTVSGLVLAGQAFGRFAPKGSDPDSDILTTTERLLAGEPYDPADPIVASGIDVYERFKSPITTEPQGEVPIFLVQGFTDALFPASEALAMVDHLHQADPSYPVKAFFGDIGHDYAAERQDDWDLVKGQMNRFLDHYLDPERTPGAPTFDVGASVTRCLPKDRDQTYVVRDSWGDLADDSVRLRSDDVAWQGASVSTATQGPSGIATDPISTATLGGPTSYKGCRVVRPAAVDPTTATVEFPVDDAGWTLLGAPVVQVHVSTKGRDLPLAVRVWDVLPDGSAQALVTRGVYRLSAAGGSGADVRFQLWPQAYRFSRGHHVRVEVTANDSPYLLANHDAATARISDLELELPVRRAATPTSSAPNDPGPTDRLGYWAVASGIIGLVLVLAFFAMVALVFLRVSRRHQRSREP